MTNEITLRYAEALFSLKKESSSLDESLKEVKELQKIIKDNPDFLMLLDSSNLSIEERINIIDKVLVNVDDEIKSLLKVMVENHRILLVNDVFEDFNSLINAERGVKEGLLYSAFEISDEQLQKINKTISEVEGHPTYLRVVIDPSIIGGIKVVVNDHIYDGSLKKRIENMKLTLLKKEDN